MTFSKNYLSNQSQPWAREVTKRIVNIENAFRSAEVNNTTRDDQLASSFRRLDANVLATQAATEDALDAINKVLGLGEPDGDPIDGSNVINNSLPGAKITANTITANEISSNYIYAGTIDADQINAGTLVGFTIKTKSTGQRVELENSAASFYDDSNRFTGQILGVGEDRGATLEMRSTGSGQVQIWSGGVISYASGGTFAALSDNGFAVGGNKLYTIDENIESGGALIASGQMSSASISNSGSYTGNGFPTIASNTVSGTTDFAPNVFISTNGNMARNTTASERRAKENIKELSFDSESFISINPVTFNYKREAVSDQEQASAKNLGFILDDFEEVGLDELLVAQPFEGDEYKQLRYNLLYMYLHKTVQEINERLKAIENG